MRYFVQYGWLDCFNEIIRWQYYPPANGRYITRRVPILTSPVPTTETHGDALW
jgi:hypothetical protein